MSSNRYLSTEPVRRIDFKIYMGIVNISTSSFQKRFKAIKFARCSKKYDESGLDNTAQPNVTALKYRVSKKNPDV